MSPRTTEDILKDEIRLVCADFFSIDIMMGGGGMEGGGGGVKGGVFVLFFIFLNGLEQ